MEELREVLRQIFLLDLVFVTGAWCWVLAQAAAKGKRGRYVIKHALYSALIMLLFGCLIAAVTVLAWVTYDIFKGVIW